jgi:hypothetical protein
MAEVSIPVERLRRVLEKIGQLKKGDLVTVIWHDACTFRVTELTPEAYVTRKKTTGTFQEVAVDVESGYPYVILEYEKLMNGLETEGTSILLSSIEDVAVEVRREKRALKAWKLVETPKTLKVRYIYRRIPLPVGLKTIGTVWKEPE